MTYSVSYDFQPGTEVYVINTLGPNGQYPYWGFPYIGAGYENFYSPGPIGYPNSYPNGFSGTTPAIMSGQVLQTRILVSQQTTSPILMYDVRITSQLGTVSFPSNMVFPSTPGTAGSQPVNYNGTLTNITVVSKQPGTYIATIYVNGVANAISIDLSTTSNIAAVLANINAILGASAAATLSGGNILITSTTLGAQSSIVIADTSLFNNLPGFVSVGPPTPGTASGLDQATAYYETLVKS